MVSVTDDGAGSNSLMATSGTEDLDKRNPFVKGPGSKEPDLDSDTASDDGSVFNGESKTEIMAKIGDGAKEIGQNTWEAFLCGNETRTKKDKEKGTIRGSALYLRQTGCSAESILKDALGMYVKGEFNVKGLTKRLEGVLSDQFDILSGDVKDALVGKLADSLGISTGNVLFAIDGIKKITSFAKSGKIKNLDELIHLIGDTGLALGIVDLSAEIAILEYAIDEAVYLGVPGAVDRVLNKVKDPDLKKEMLIRNADKAAVNGDITIVNMAIDTAGGDVILIRNPTIINNLVLNYNISSIDERSLEEQHLELIDTLNKLDSNWRNKERNNESVSKLEHFTHMSKDARKVLAYDDQFFVELIISEVMDQPHYKDVSKSIYGNIM